MAKARTAQRKKRGARRSKEDLIRDSLLSQRQEILSQYEHDLRVGQESGDEASEDIVDRANNAYQRELMFNISGGERKILQQIEGALGRLDSGSYGVCDHCGEKIGAQRLKAIPWARYCVDCQEKEEQGSLE